MRFSVAAVLAFVASAFAQTPDFDPIYTPKKDEIVPAGSSFTLTWDAPAKYTAGTISIELIGGATQNTQQHIANIASGVKNSAKTYTWNVDAALGDQKVYGLVFKLESNPSVFQYSNPFHIKASDSKSAGSDAVTSTTPQGVKTILLSSTTPPTSAAAPSTTCTGSNTSTTSISSSTSSSSTSTASTTETKHHDAIANCTTLVVSTSSQSTPATVAPSGSIPGTTTTPLTPIPTAAASAIRAGSLTILGVVAAFLAL
ncbi:hypothetical protein C2857_005380 [Epichloe festucae Fl1]|uniref:Yeast cell wall synthesis Kre9/Knh1-like N-terminal domain-containing protein n=1 Tax=Epichloe festucae (strain Fl1) TaxID=877507 RepID=A0A7S9KSU7_EPIFF|nr:hypothetical protein C2857_005380 [Epichloe festucae Fl1]